MNTIRDIGARTAGFATGRFFRALAVMVLMTSAILWVLPAGAGAAGEMAATVAESDNAFAVDVYGALKSQPGNLFLSPYSISSALAMTSEGARGETRSQMAAVLHAGPDATAYRKSRGALAKRFDAIAAGRNVELAIANALWPQENYVYRKEFIGIATGDYRAGVHPVNYVKDAEGARARINSWASDNTHGKIPELIGPGVLNSMTRMVLTNAVYFLGGWLEPFDKNDTKDGDFTRLDGSKVAVPLMYQSEKFDYAEEPGLQVLAMPYKGRDLIMTVVLPRETAGLPELEERLAVDSFRKWRDGLSYQKVRVTFPRYKYSAGFELGDVLRGLGMTDAFDPAKADFSGMDGTRQLFVSNVIHKAFVDVDEKGTEAAAATGVVMSLAAAPMPDEPKEFRADHPFLFYISDRQSGAVLFLGRVVDPS